MLDAPEPYDEPTLEPPYIDEAPLIGDPYEALAPYEAPLDACCEPPYDCIGGAGYDSICGGAYDWVCCDLSGSGSGIGNGMIIFFFFIKANNGSTSLSFLSIFFLLMASVSCTWLTSSKLKTTTARIRAHLVLLLVANIV